MTSIDPQQNEWTESESKILGIPKQRDVIAHDAHFGVSTRCAKRHMKGRSEDLSK